MARTGLGLATGGNLPPTGHGVYARAQDVDWLMKFDFVVLNGVRSDAYGKARALVAAGKQVWFYAFPSWWAPTGDDAARVARMEQLIDETGAAGAIADPENGWESVSGSRVQALADAIKASIARGYRWGVTSYPELLTRLTPLASSGAWAAPQLYRAQQDNTGFYARWQAVFGAARTVPSAALWYVHMRNEPPDFPTLADYAEYLSRLPGAAGAIGWTTDQTTDDMVQVFLAWQPWSKAYVHPPSTSTGPLFAAAGGAIFGLWMIWRRWFR